MMARTSPFLMSNDTSRIARTPPNDSDTFSIDSNTSPAAISLGVGALMARASPPSFRGGPKGRARNPGPFAHAALDSGFAAARHPGMTWRGSCRHLHGRLGRHCRHVADFHPRRDHTLAPVLESHLRRNRGLLRTVV